jgi:hypothetical protein
MRGLALVFLVGCAVRGGGSPDDPPVFDPGRGPGRGPSNSCSGGCPSDRVCARTGMCLPLDQVRAIHVSWTVSGQPASQTSCASSPDLLIELTSSIGVARLAYAPVPCVEGKFSVDKSPISIDQASLIRELGGGRPQQATIDATTGEASLDLPY